ncbi:uncharacterized protein LOC120655388 isoform X2 [Panicum virgatum]|uniref:uncharacterized protein LOC120655388 isoform X2 n=1 Tax=Panicum virgatum TaxID=38727 RepID=UPI0019D4FB99|nr:uncharacterized protein LOC120655388 isoform X2 [Panicum virgatum]
MAPLLSPPRFPSPPRRCSQSPPLPRSCSPPRAPIPSPSAASGDAAARGRGLCGARRGDTMASKVHSFPKPPPTSARTNAAHHLRRRLRGLFCQNPNLASATMDKSGSAPIFPNVRTPKGAFRDFRDRRAGIVKALTTGAIIKIAEERLEDSWVPLDETVATEELEEMIHSKEVHTNAVILESVSPDSKSMSSAYTLLVVVFIWKMTNLPMQQS